MAAKSKKKTVPRKPPSESKAAKTHPMPPWVKEPHTKADGKPKKKGGKK